MARVHRFEATGRLAKFERTGSGGFRVPAYVARTGIQVYLDANGREIRELRAPDEVFADEALRSFDDAPVTDLHPPDSVTPETWRHYAVGTVRSPRKDGERVAVDTVITDADMIRKIEAGDRVECSAGYTCELDMTPGVWNGQRYDAVQRKIRGNHVGLGPRGWGRAGPEVRLRLDGQGNQVRADREDQDRTMNKVKVDGIEYEAGSESHLQALDKLIAALRGERDDLKARLDTIGEKLAAETARADSGISAERLDEAVEARMLIIERARRVLGVDFAPKGKSNRDICLAGLERLQLEVREDACEDIIRALFIGATHDVRQDASDDDCDDRRDGVIVTETAPKPKPARYEMPDISQKWRHGPQT